LKFDQFQLIPIISFSKRKKDKENQNFGKNHLFFQKFYFSQKNLEAAQSKTLVDKRLII
jgi:hypothetical protein